MKARWQVLAAKFAALQQREKLLVTVMTVAVIGMGGHTVGVEPAQKRAAVLKKQIGQQKTEMQMLQTQVTILRAAVSDPDAANKAALAEARQKIAASDADLRQYDSKLVPPERVPQLLQSLFVRHPGLQLVSLETLPPSPLLAPPPTGKEASATAGKAGADRASPPGKAGDKTPPPPAENGGNIHKHGIEIRMAGNYLDLLAYVSELERLPQKLLWGHLSLSTPAWPISELTLRVYTLSLDRVWMLV